MDKVQALHEFWSSFGLPAWDENTVPDEIDVLNQKTGKYERVKNDLPYITYEVKTDSLDNMVLLSASIWYRSNSWEDISKKAEEIARHISEMRPPSIKLDEGRLYITKGTPFAQRMSDPDTTIRRILLNVNAEFFTSY